MSEAIEQNGEKGTHNSSATYAWGRSNGWQLQRANEAAQSVKVSLL